MSKIYVYQDGMTEEEQKNGAYFERNMLALFHAKTLNNVIEVFDAKGIKHVHQKSGWYLHGEWEGWSRVISIDGGKFTFHVPDDFDLGDLPQIEPNWDGHSTVEKWKRVMHTCGVSHGS